MSNQSFVICVSNDGYAVSLEPRKIYRVVADEKIAARGLLRVIDESGEDYLYPDSMFAPIELSEAARKALHLAA
ncbi:MAG: hypothetical protein ACREP1_00290 [Rhodanobacteraceae bacterium]